jgi:stage III sporulation protein AE
MKRILMLLCLLPMLVMPVKALDYTAPEPPDSAQELMPAHDATFAEGLWKILQQGLGIALPIVRNTAATCTCLMAVTLLTALLRSIPGNTGNALELASGVATGLILINGSGSLISVASDTVLELSEYGKLLLPMLAGALASQGGTTTATALYAGTAAFDAVLTSLLQKVLIPGVSMYLILGLVAAATDEGGVKKLKAFLKWLTVWMLKCVLYIFTGYMTITGAVSGSADAATIKAAKLTISSMVPVVGGILSDASEAIVVGAGVMKGAVGVYGVLAITAIWLTPFVRIGVQYLMLKVVGAFCAGFDLKRSSGLIEDFASAMGLLLAMTGTVLVLLLVSTVCFMKAVT